MKEREPPTRILYHKKERKVKMEKFYFTFGTDKEYPHYGGWVTITVPKIPGVDSEDVARAIFVLIYPSNRLHDGMIPVARYADVYPNDRFRKTRMPRQGKFGKYCHEQYRLEFDGHLLPVIRKGDGTCFAV